jgi:RimJ/RimL family protein N-acetyltransferase
MLTTVMAGSGLRSVVLDIEEGNLASMRVADRLGAERRAPVRVKPDRFGVERTLAAYVLMLPPS